MTVMLPLPPTVALELPPRVKVELPLPSETMAWLAPALIRSLPPSP